MLAGLKPSLTNWPLHCLKVPVTSSFSCRKYKATVRIESGISPSLLPCLSNKASEWCFPYCPSVRQIKETDATLFSLIFLLFVQFFYLMFVLTVFSRASSVLIMGYCLPWPSLSPPCISSGIPLWYLQCPFHLLHSPQPSSHFLFQSLPKAFPIFSFTSAQCFPSAFSNLSNS